MKRILLIALAITVFAGQAIASAGLAGLFGGEKDVTNVGNVWYDRNFNFSKVKLIAVYPMEAQFDLLFWQKYPRLREIVTPDSLKAIEQDQFMWSKAGLFPNTYAYRLSRDTQTGLTRCLLEKFQNEVKPVFLVNGEPQAKMPASNPGDIYAAYRKAHPYEGKTPEQAEEVLSRHFYSIEYPDLLDLFDSEAARGAAVRSATGAQAYLRWRMEGPYTPDSISFSVRHDIHPLFPSGLKTAAVTLYTSFCCELYDDGGNKVLAYSAKTPMKCNVLSSGGIFYPGNDESKFVEDLVANLKKLAIAKSAPVAPFGSKTVRVGEVTLGYLEGEETYPAEVDITKQALATTILENATSETLRGVDGETSDYLVEAAVTDCSVKIASGGGNFKAELKATLRLVDTKTGAVVATLQDEASGRSESEAFGKLVKKFFKEANKAVK